MVDYREREVLGLAKNTAKDDYEGTQERMSVKMGYTEKL